MIVRHLINFKKENELPEWQAWVVESDAVRDITSPSIDDSVDLESDISPFVAYQDNSDDVNLLRAQTEKFLGQRFDLSKGWGEVNESVRRHIPKLTTMSSSSPLFPDNLNPRIPLTVPNFPVIISGNFLPLSPYYIPSTTFTKPNTD